MSADTEFKPSLIHGYGTFAKKDLRKGHILNIKPIDIRVFNFSEKPNTVSIPISLRICKYLNNGKYQSKLVMNYWKLLKNVKKGDELLVKNLKLFPTHCHWPTCLTPSVFLDREKEFKK